MFTVLSFSITFLHRVRRLFKLMGRVLESIMRFIVIVVDSLFSKLNLSNVSPPTLVEDKRNACLLF